MGQTDTMCTWPSGQHSTRDGACTRCGAPTDDKGRTLAELVRLNVTSVRGVFETSQTTDGAVRVITGTRHVVIVAPDGVVRLQSRFHAPRVTIVPTWDDWHDLEAPDGVHNRATTVSQIVADIVNVVTAGDTSSRVELVADSLRDATLTGELVELSYGTADDYRQTSVYTRDDEHTWLVQTSSVYGNGCTTDDAFSSLWRAERVWRDAIRSHLDAQDMSDEGAWLEADTRLHVTSVEDVARSVLELGSFTFTAAGRRFTIGGI